MARFNGRGTGVSVTQLLRGVEQDLEQVRNEFLKAMVQEIVKESPVDTGTYILSHNVGEASASGQYTGGLRYIGPPGQSESAMKGAALAKLEGQIESLSAEQTRVNISNNSAHARIVEDGGYNWKRGPFNVYRNAAARASHLLGPIVARVKGGS